MRKRKRLERKILEREMRDETRKMRERERDIPIMSFSFRWLYDGRDFTNDFSWSPDVHVYHCASFKSLLHSAFVNIVYRVSWYVTFTSSLCFDARGMGVMIM